MMNSSASPPSTAPRRRAERKLGALHRGSWAIVLLGTAGLGSALEGCASETPSDVGSAGGFAPSGGSQTGGTVTSGGATGGRTAAESGGAVTSGGAAIGGSVASGGASGGAGASTGGASAGGASSGGSPNGGVGGTATGGATPEGGACSAGVWDGQTKTPLGLRGNTFAHDPTVLRVGDTYYRFWTGEFIPSAKSTNLIDWSNAPTVYGNSYPAWVQDWLGGVPDETFNFPWAPEVSSFGGKVHIYSSFSAKFGDNVSCITHLSTSDVEAGNWEDSGPIICTEGNERYNAIDADIGFDSEGRPFLAFGSFWDGIFAFELNIDGSRKGTDLTRLASAAEIEAPVLFRRCNYYYLFVTFGLCCPGEGRRIDQLTYRVVVGRSENMLGPYVDRDGKGMLEGGGSLIVEGDKTAWAAAGHSDVFVDGDKIYHTYHAYRQSNGDAVFRLVELPFDEDGWPVPHAP
jgi:arabinan endo-1,5-alpha-L-arabinosidase